MSPSQASETCASASSATSAKKRLVIMRMGLEGVNRGELSEGRGVLTAFSGGTGCCDNGASRGDCCPSGGRDYVASGDSSGLSTLCYVVVRGRPNVRRAHRGS